MTSRSRDDALEIPDAVAHWKGHGFVILPGYVPSNELAPGQRELALLFPTPEEFHSDPDDRQHAKYRGDEFAGIIDFPFASVELSLLAVHPRLVALAKAMLGTSDLRLYSAEAWAKFAGAADYDQPHHRDYLNHTLLVPTEEPAFQQVEMFLYLCDVPEELGPPRFVSRTHTHGAAAFPNWLSRDERPDWYAAEVSGAGPAGTVAAYSISTFHRGTALTAFRGARYTIHVSYRAAGTEWADRRAWANQSHEPAWYSFVARASLRQLLLFGFPPPGHPFWTEETLAAMALRYPGLDLAPFHQ
jgi:phytanoyl-CoA dioxygenase PhyH